MMGVWDVYGALTHRVAFRDVVVRCRCCAYCRWIRVAIDHLSTNTKRVLVMLRPDNSIARPNLMVRPIIDSVHVRMVQLHAKKPRNLCFHFFFVNQIFSYDFSLFANNFLFLLFLAELYVVHYLQWTLSETRFETAGGTSFDAIHKYAPICLRSKRLKRKTDPL